MRVGLAETHRRRWIAALLIGVGVGALAATLLQQEPVTPKTQCRSLIEHVARVECVARQEQALLTARRSQQIATASGVTLLVAGAALLVKLRPRLVDVARAAEWIGVKPSLVRRWIDEGALTPHPARDGSRMRVDYDEVLRLNL